jgi:serine/threonine protein phosphatase 1
MTLRWTACKAPTGEVPPAARTPEGTAVYAIGDIHGRIDLLDEMLEGIRQDARSRRAWRHVLVFLGDYVSRAPGGREAIQRALDPRLPGFEVVRLKGNHEDLLLRFLDGYLPAGGHWLEYGGFATLAEYGIEAPPSAKRDRVRLEALRERMIAALPADDLKFLHSLKISHTEGGYYFVHAGVRPGVALAAQSERDRIWIRRRFLLSDADFGAVVVHGHCIAAAPETRRNRIGIDTGAYRSGILTCLVLEGEERAFLQTVPADVPAMTCT